MAFDGITLALVKQEILSLGDGVRVDRIHQPSGDEIILSFRYRGGSRRYLLSASASTARIHSVKSTPENPMTPPMFLSLIHILVSVFGKGESMHGAQPRNSWIQ